MGWKPTTPSRTSIATRRRRWRWRPALSERPAIISRMRTGCRFRRSIIALRCKEFSCRATDRGADSVKDDLVILMIGRRRKNRDQVKRQVGAVLDRHPIKALGRYWPARPAQDQRKGLARRRPPTGKLAP